MTPRIETSPVGKRRLAARLEPFARVEDIAAWGAAHLDFLREHLPYAHGVPGERGDDRDARFTGAGLRIDTTTDAIQAHRARHQRSKPARARDAARRLGSRDPGAPACPRGRHARRVSR